MALELYWGRGSPYSWRVQLALEIKRLPYISKQLRFSEQDLKSTEFLAVNPRAQVPALCDGEFCLYESIAILCYLDQKHPDPPLFGAHAAECGLIWQLVMECVYYLEPYMTSFAGTILSGELQGKQDETVASREAVEQELAMLERRLAGRDYLAAQSISAADVTYYPVIQLLQIAALRENTEAISGSLRRMDTHYPEIAAWRRRIENLPGFSNTNPPHWYVQTE